MRVEKCVYVGAQVKRGGGAPCMSMRVWLSVWMSEAGGVGVWVHEGGCVGTQLERGGFLYDMWVWLSLCRSSYRDCVKTCLESVGMSCSIPIPYSMCRRGT